MYKSLPAHFAEVNCVGNKVCRFGTSTESLDELSLVEGLSKSVQPGLNKSKQEGSQYNKSKTTHAAQIIKEYASNTTP